MGALCSRSDKKYAIETSGSESARTSDKTGAVIPLRVSLKSNSRTDDPEGPPSPSGVTKADHAGSSGGRGDSDEVVTNIEQDQYAPRKNRVRNENESKHRQLVYGQRQNMM